MNPQPPRPVEPLDEDALARLRALDPDGQHNVMGRVLGTYETSLVNSLVQAAEARDSGDRKRIGELAHKLKSSSASVGALALAALCAEIERTVRSGAEFDLAAQVETLLTESERALTAVRAMLRP